MGIPIVNKTPLLPQGAVPAEAQSLARFDQELIQALFTEMTQHALSLNTLSNSISDFILTLLNNADAATAQKTLGLREQYTTDRQYFVRSDGNNANTGTVNSAGGAWRNVNFALNKIANVHDLRGFASEVKTGGATYTDTTPVVVAKPFIGGLVTLTGDTTTPSNCTLTPTAGNPAIRLNNGAQLQIQGLRVSSTAGGTSFMQQNSPAIWASNGSLLFPVGNMEYHTTAGWQIFLEGGSKLDITANYSITGSAGEGHIGSITGSYAQVMNRTVTIGAVTLGLGFIDATTAGQLRCDNTILSGSWTGPGYRKILGAGIYTGFLGPAFFTNHSSAAGIDDNTGFGP